MARAKRLAGTHSTANNQYFYVIKLALFAGLKGYNIMRYILTGKYANGDDYAEATENLADLAYIISEINRWHDHASVGENLRVDATTLVIETEVES